MHKDYESDYCDLNPTKICDNCCRCLDKDVMEAGISAIHGDSQEIEISLMRTDSIRESGMDDALTEKDFSADLSSEFYDDTLQDDPLAHLFPEDLEEELEAGEDEWESCDSSHVEPLAIDPALAAEWEAKLRAYEMQEKQAYMRTLRGKRKKPEQED